MLKIVEIKEQKEWDEFVGTSGGHPLQLWNWGELKANHNWQVHRIFVKNVSKKYADYKRKDTRDVVATAQILIRKLPWPLKSFAYIPRGALILSQKPPERAKILKEIANYCTHNIKPKPVCLSIEPDWKEFPEDLVDKDKWRRTKNTILLPKTILIDLEKSDEDLLAAMSKKTRQYIRKSSQDISVRQIENDDDFETCLDIYESTAERANFNLHDRDYYREIRQLFGDKAPIFAAFAKVEETDDQDQGTEVEAQPTQPKDLSEKTIDVDRINLERYYGNKINQEREMVAFLWPVLSNKIAFELYGGVTERGQTSRANYILKWLTLKQVQSAGVKQYDVNGLLNDGISNFKRGFAGHEDEFCGTFDRPLSPFYFIWSHFLPLGKKIVRKLKR